MPRKKTFMLELSPAEHAFNKLYFVNMLTGAGIKYPDVATARVHSPSLAEIADKLSVPQLNYLIDRIESKL